MSLRLIREYTAQDVCRHPEHLPPGNIVLRPGVWEHTCPACGHKTQFIVPLVTC